MKDLLPLGSVVSLKDATKSLMIIGKRIVSNNEKFDYLSVLFPEGYISKESFYSFNNGDIEEVKFLGCINVESQVFDSLVKEEDDKNM